MYALRYHATAANPYSTLVELTPAQAKALDDRGMLHDGRWGYEYVSNTFAHRWVRTDGHHETNLYLDSDGRIRRARDA